MGSAKKGRKKKIVRYRKRFYLNIVLCVFLFLLVYLGLQVYYLHTGKGMQICEVAEGSLVKDNTFHGIVWRDERIVNADTAGYVNFYLREEKRTAVGDLVCTLDESGKMQDLLDQSQAAGVTTLTEENLKELRNELFLFDKNFDLMDFSSIYDVQTELDNILFELINLETMNGIGSSDGSEGIIFDRCYAPYSGVVMYAMDGYENLQENIVTKDTFDRSSYEEKSIESGSMVSAGQAIYKTVVSEDWSIFFPLTRENREEYGLKDNVFTVRFTKNGLTMKANYSTFYGADGEVYGRLDFNRYMIQFVEDRYLEFDIITSEITGLKVPTTAIVDKEFFIIPIDYLARGGNSNEDGFFVQALVEGQARPKFQSAVIYYRDEEYCYVNTDVFSVGDYLVKPDSTETYLVRNKASLPVVYNMNKGFAVFKLVDILTSNEEYTIVRQNTAYGLNLYDRIAIDGSQIKDGEIFY